MDAEVLERVRDYIGNERYGVNFQVAVGVGISTTTSLSFLKNIHTMNTTPKTITVISNFLIILF